MGRIWRFGLLVAMVVLGSSFLAHSEESLVSPWADEASVNAAVNKLLGYLESGPLEADALVERLTGISPSPSTGQTTPPPPAAAPEPATAAPVAAPAATASAAAPATAPAESPKPVSKESSIPLGSVPIDQTLVDLGNLAAHTSVSTNTSESSATTPANQAVPPTQVVPAGQTAPERVTIKPIAPPPAGEYGYLGITIQAPWMKGPIRLRMPEMLSSQQGVHFLDHKRDGTNPLSMLNPFPEWKTDPATGDLSYEVTTPEGLVFGGKAHAEPDSVHLEFWVANGTKDTVQNITAQMCLLLADSPEFGKKNDLAHTFTWFNGAPASVSMTTPNAEQKGRPAWLIILTSLLAPVYAGAREYPDGAWVVEQFCDYNLIARASDDLRYLVGLTWDEAASEVICNSTVPCMHAGPSRAITLQVREKATWRGKVYLIANDTENLLGRYSKDAEVWFAQKN